MLLFTLVTFFHDRGKLRDLFLENIFCSDSPNDKNRLSVLSIRIGGH